MRYLFTGLFTLVFPPFPRPDMMNFVRDEDEWKSATGTGTLKLWRRWNWFTQLTRFAAPKTWFVVYRRKIMKVSEKRRLGGNGNLFFSSRPSLTAPSLFSIALASFCLFVRPRPANCLLWLLCLQTRVHSPLPFFDSRSIQDRWMRSNRMINQTLLASARFRLHGF
jgi:hypothetical protein